MVVGFTISAEYAATRPASSAIFLSVFTSYAIPWVWLASVPINLAIVYLYNRFLPKIGPLKMVGITSSIIVLMHIFCAFFLPLFPSFIFVQFIWKDIYILLMFKQLWSMIHSTIPANRAKYLYGVIFGVGTIGAIFGSLIPSFLAVLTGSEKLFLCTLPFYAILYFCYKEAFKRSSLEQESFIQNLTVDPRPREGFSLIRKSRYLLIALLLVVFMQVSVGLMDYQFNTYLEINIFDKDVRTEYVGQIVGFTNLLSLVLQVFGSFIMVKWFGIRGSHLFVPIALLANAFLAFAFPLFGTISFSYVLIKAVDFSLFGVIRELLYIPMKLDEKFRAKAIIDVFAYRSSKALVSLCILGLQAFLGAEILGITSVFSIGAFCLWIALVFFLFYRKMEARSIYTIYQK